ncbi:MAG: hypothetical protein JOZ87_19015 [Chloroflexi bacterium]|nr:hypothetical protein [Chloroflexota bacterium]
MRVAGMPKTRQMPLFLAAAEPLASILYGAIEVLMVDIDTVVPGTFDEATGRISLTESPSADTYGVVEAIAAQALSCGARVLGVRSQDIPQRMPLAAILRHALPLTAGDPVPNLIDSGRLRRVGRRGGVAWSFCQRLRVTGLSGPTRRVRERKRPPDAVVRLVVASR